MMTAMARQVDPAVRSRLIEVTARQIALGEPVTLRGVTAAAGTSTMAVYTHFGGMDGLWSSIRREGFVRLRTRLAALTPGRDPVTDLTEVGAVYARAALEEPDLYSVMFDNRRGEPRPTEADETFGVLVDAVGRAKDAGRFPRVRDAVPAATQLWASTHGAVTLTITGALDPDALPSLPSLLTAMATSAYVGFGDDPAAARRSVRRIWPAT